MPQGPDTSLLPDWFQPAIHQANWKYLNSDDSHRKVIKTKNIAFCGTSLQIK